MAKHYDLDGSSDRWRGGEQPDETRRRRYMRAESTDRTSTRRRPILRTRCPRKRSALCALKDPAAEVWGPWMTGRLRCAPVHRGGGPSPERRPILLACGARVLTVVPSSPRGDIRERRSSSARTPALSLTDPAWSLRTISIDDVATNRPTMPPLSAQARASHERGAAHRMHHDPHRSEARSLASSR